MYRDRQMGLTKDEREQEAFELNQLIQYVCLCGWEFGVVCVCVCVWDCVCVFWCVLIRMQHHLLTETPNPLPNTSHTPYPSTTHRELTKCGWAAGVEDPKEQHLVIAATERTTALLTRAQELQTAKANGVAVDWTKDVFRYGDVLWVWGGAGE